MRPSLFAALLLALPAPAATPLPAVPPGFKVELVLEAPAIEAPSALAVAPNGDVYFAEDPMDMAGPPTEPIDRIWLLKGGDPAKKVLFADRMWAVMGLELVGDTLYCVHAPHVTAFKLNADGTVKSRADVFDDLGPKVAGLPGFNDHIPSGIRMGMDGYLYVSIGDKGIPKMARKETDQGSVHVAEGRWRHTKEGHHISLEGGGVIRFRPDGTRLEVFASGTRNHLDVPMDEHDRIFVRDNTDDGLGWWTRLMYLPRGGFLGYPWAYTKRPAECLPMIRDFGGGSPCGGWVYCDDGLPETYRGRVFHCEWGQGKVYAVKLAPDGAGFKFVDQLAFMDPSGTGLKDFRPFTLRPTADGRGFYVTDWGFGGWRQNVKAGRLWKVTYAGDDVKPAPRGKDTDSVEELVKSLGHPAHTERLRAQRALIGQGKAAVESAFSQLKDTRAPTNVRIGAMWVLVRTEPAKVIEWIATLKSASELAADLAIEVYRGLADPVLLKTLLALGIDATPSVFHLMVDPILTRDEFNPALARQKYDKATTFAAIQALHAFETCEGVKEDGEIGPCGGILPSAFATLYYEESDPYVRAALLRYSRDNLRAGFAKLLVKETRRDQLLEGPATPITLTGEQVQRLAALGSELFHMSSLEVMTQLVKNRDATIRRIAVEALARNYKDRKPYTGVWWGTQPAKQPLPKREVEWEGTPIVRATVEKALADPAAEVRDAALAAMAEWADVATLPALRERFAVTDDAGFRLRVVKAVAGMADAKKVEFLVPLLEDAGEPLDLRLAALAGLGNAKDAADVVARVAVANGPPSLRGQAIRTLGEMKAPQTVAVCEGVLKAADAKEFAEPCLKALASARDAKAGPLVLPYLADGSPAVRKAAIEAAGALRLRDAIPELVRQSADAAVGFDAIAALTRMPDARALPGYLTGLASKNGDQRKACAKALERVRDAVRPTLEQLAARNELTPPVITELQKVYGDDGAKYAFLKGGKPKFDVEAFRKHARKTAGDATRGEALFRDLKGLACVKCHAVGGQGGTVGPDLAGVGARYSRDDLVTSVLEPSKVISQGYETINVLLTSGKSLQGVFKGETADAVRLADAEGKEHTVAKKEIDERSFSPVSTMPQGLQDGLSLADFADLIAYLEARKEKK